MKEKKISSKLIFEGKIMKVYKDDVLLDNGRTSTREVVIKPQAVCILPIIDDKVILIKQFRYPLNKVVYELPAGMIEHDEIPLNAAIRELEEETGYKALEINSLGNIYTSFGFTDELIHLYYACNLVKTHVNFDFDEDIETYMVNFDELLNMIKNGDIVDAKTICAINNYILFNK